MSQRGAGGGARLSRPASDITLLDVYRAVGEESDLLLVHDRTNLTCPVGRHIQTALDHHFHAATRALEGYLDRTSIADLGRDVQRLERRRGTRRAAR